MSGQWDWMPDDLREVMERLDEMIASMPPLVLTESDIRGIQEIDEAMLAVLEAEDAS